MNRPEATEYADYYANYIAKVPGNDVLSVLESQRLQMLQLFAGRSERDGSFRYAPGKWSVKEVFGHITDTERVFTYRALRIARGDQTPLPGFEQDDFVKNGAFGERTLASLAEEFGLVRSASVALFSFFPGGRLVAARGGQPKRSDRTRAGVHDRGASDTPPRHPGRALLSGDSARLSRGANSRPDEGMIDVNALIRQITP